MCVFLRVREDRSFDVLIIIWDMFFLDFRMSKFNGKIRKSISFVIKRYFKKSSFTVFEFVFLFFLWEQNTKMIRAV